MIHAEKPRTINDFPGEIRSATSIEEAALERILASSSFRRCPRLREFLSFSAACTLRGEDVTEQRIGEEVFGRIGRFNPAEDNIVRATARSLRAKLREYYETEGSTETLRVEVPKGSYQPVFCTVEPGVPATDESQPERRRRVSSLAIATVLAMTIALAWLAVDNYRLRIGAVLPSEAPTLLASLIGETGAVHIIASDGLHHHLQDLRGSLTSLEDYASKQVFAAPVPGEKALPDSLWSLIREQRLTNVQDVRAALQLAQHLGPRRVVRLQHARSVTMESLQMGDNLVLIGGRRANPWVGLYEQDLNFQMEFSPDTQSAQIHNRQPRPGEQSVYTTMIDENDSGRAFARVAFVPGMSGKGRVLLLAGTNGYATMAACDLLVQPRMLAELGSLLGKRRLDELARLEVLLETSAIGGGTMDFRIIAVR